MCTQVVVRTHLKGLMRELECNYEQMESNKARKIGGRSLRGQERLCGIFEVGFQASAPAGARMGRNYRLEGSDLPVSRKPALEPLSSLTVCPFYRRETEMLRANR